MEQGMEDGGWGMEQRIVIELELSATGPFFEAQVGLSPETDNEGRHKKKFFFT